MQEVSYVFNGSSPLQEDPDLQAGGSGMSDVRAWHLKERIVECAVIVLEERVLFRRVAAGRIVIAVHLLALLFGQQPLLPAHHVFYLEYWVCTE